LSRAGVASALPCLPSTELRSIARGLAASAVELGHLAAGAEREWQLVAESEAFEAWIIGWPSGGSLELHDHGGSRGMLSVVAGRLVETSVAQLGARLTLRARTVSAATRPLWIGRNRVHDLTNRGPGPALSVHVYSPRLTSMTFFAMEGGKLQVRRTEHLGWLPEAAGRRAS